MQLSDSLSLYKDFRTFPCSYEYGHSKQVKTFKILWLTFIMKYVLVMNYPLDKVIRPLNNWGQDST